tara:strand:- start:277 stop:543 length:267 start_codon:yes stop_codon:yes gene_type:complete
MKFELKTENDKDTKSFRFVFLAMVALFLIIILCNIAFKLGDISRHYQLNYFCRLLIVEKSSYNFKKLSKLSNLKNKQKIWEFCREVVN